ncbi:MAG TPA: nucleotide exchange factor GrpE [Thermoanaerobaculia bacterium]|nr:nucleotide exchange factor GrpE [Thermoanaerobaculia bacterium]HRR14504.1 nucleotide exchange factor GrpE [Thermoanaerobaculia bacterium]HRS35589.1 nucleotide exchange factor GrpE [Thermoanaerobaculia bacterium]
MEETKSDDPEAFADDAEIEILSIEAESDEDGVVYADSGTHALPEAEGAPEGAEVGVLRRELEELRDRALRTLADFDNYRKRSERERLEQRQLAVADVLRELLPVVDNLERALAAEGDVADLHRGVELTARQLREVLGRFDLQEIVALDQPFDPRFHEAVSRLESAVVTVPTVTSELQRGYLMGSRLLRPSLVVVTVPAVPGEAGGEAAGGDA